MNNSTCGYCRKTFTGRVDKLFCNDHCRVAFHNNKTKDKDNNNYTRMINALIKKNRNILKSVFEEEVNSVHYGALVIKGFSFSFFTHETASKSGEVFRFCYDYGYRINKEGEVLIINTFLFV
ncbi:MAG: hypothetical protein ACK50E_04070 [Bacteroidota bacterium]